MELPKSPALSKCALPYSSRHLMVKGRSPGVHRVAAWQSRTRIVRLTDWNRSVGETVAGRAGVRTSRPWPGVPIPTTVEVTRPDRRRALSTCSGLTSDSGRFGCVRAGSASKSMSSTACSSARLGVVALVGPATTAPRPRRRRRRPRRLGRPRRVVATCSRATAVESGQPEASPSAVAPHHRRRPAPAKRMHGEPTAHRHERAPTAQVVCEGGSAVGISAPGHGAVHGAKWRQPVELKAGGGAPQRSPDAWRKPVAMASDALVMRRSSNRFRQAAL